MKKILVCLIVTGVLISVSASAGNKVDAPVTVAGTNTSGTASGALGSARNSGDGVQYINCQIVSQVSSSPTVTCNAKNSAGTTLSCTSTDVNIVATARSLNGDSWIWFWVSNSACQSLVVSNSSQYPPKAP